MLVPVGHFLLGYAVTALAEDANARGNSPQARFFFRGAVLVFASPLLGWPPVVGAQLHAMGRTARRLAERLRDDEALNEALSHGNAAVSAQELQPGLFPDEHVASLDTLASIQALMGRAEEAKDTYERSLQRCRSSGPQIRRLLEGYALLNLASHLQEMGLYAESLPFLEEVLARDELQLPIQRDDVLRQYSLALEKSGNLEKAADIQRWLLSAKPHQPTAAFS
jgi:tetratricopeptide (TPR) repeat protein